MRICWLSGLAVTMMCSPAMVSGATVSGTLFVNLTTTVAVQDVYPIFILCNDVPAASCNPGAPLPLIHIESEGSSPAFPNGVQDTFSPINFNSSWSGFITYVALPQGSSSNVVIGLRNVSSLPARLGRSRHRRARSLRTFSAARRPSRRT